MEGEEVLPDPNSTIDKFFVTEKGFVYEKRSACVRNQQGGQIFWQPEVKSETRTPQTSAPPPYSDSTLHVVKDTLFAFGGRDKDNQPTSDVLRYNSDTDSWESAGYMRTARHGVTVVTIQQEGDTEIFVIGGSIGSTFSKSVEKCIIKEHTN